MPDVGKLMSLWACLHTCKMAARAPFAEQGGPGLTGGQATFEASSTWLWLWPEISCQQLGLGPGSQTGQQLPRLGAVGPCQAQCVTSLGFGFLFRVLGIIIPSHINTRGAALRSPTRQALHGAWHAGNSQQMLLLLFSPRRLLDESLLSWQRVTAQRRPGAACLANLWVPGFCRTAEGEHPAVQVTPQRLAPCQSPGAAF